jgi:hypothetical protein
MQQPQMRLPECSEFPQALLSPGPDGELPLDPDRLTHGRFLDPWGNDYAYRKLSVLKFEVISFGRDGSPGGEGEDAEVSKRVQLR